MKHVSDLLHNLSFLDIHSGFKIQQSNVKISKVPTDFKEYEKFRKMKL